MTGTKSATALNLPMVEPLPDETQKYFDICKKWEEITNLNLEHGEYSKLILADVNNYIAVNKEKEVSKEDFESFENLSELLFYFPSIKKYLTPTQYEKILHTEENCYQVQTTKCIKTLYQTAGQISA